MKKTSLIVLNSTLLLFLYSCGANPSVKEASFYVRGNCGMCEERIESTAKALSGVENADWNVKTKMLVVTYDSLKIDETKIQQSVANVGHETKTFQSPQGVHDALPECCKKGSSM